MLLTAKTVRKWMPIASLTRDPALQMRVNGNDAEQVLRFRETIAAGGQLAPCEVVSDGQTNWLTDGWQRTAALEAEDRGQVECDVYSGNYLDARFRALSSNSKHGLNRTYDDMRRAIHTLLDTPDLLKRAQELAQNNGGFHRSVASACGVSVAFVVKLLADRGQYIHAGRVATRPEPAPQPAPQPQVYSNTGPRLFGREQNQSPVQSPTAQAPRATAPRVPEPPSAAEQAAFADECVKRARAMLQRLTAEVEALLAGPLAAQVRAAAKKAGAPLKDAEVWGPLAAVRRVLTETGKAIERAK